MFGPDLHTVVRGAVTAVHPDERVVRYRSVGQSNVRGKMVPAYAEPETLDAQIQSEKDDALYHAARADENSVTRTFYLRTPAGLGSRVAGIVRPLARNGDMFFRPEDGTWWLVVAVVEDFSSVGWSRARCTLQVNGPEGVEPPGAGGGTEGEGA